MMGAISRPGSPDHFAGVLVQKGKQFAMPIGSEESNTQKPTVCFHFSSLSLSSTVGIHFTSTVHYIVNPTIHCYYPYFEQFSLKDIYIKKKNTLMFMDEVAIPGALHFFV